MRLQSIQYYKNGVYHLYDEKYKFCPFIEHHGLKNGYDYMINLYNGENVCKFCTDNYKTLVFRGLVHIPPTIEIWRK